MDGRMVFCLAAGIVIAFVIIAGCSETPAPPTTPAAPGISPVSHTQAPASTRSAQQTTLPVSTPLTLSTVPPASLSCPDGYIAGGDGDNRCYASCNPGKRCRNADDFCCGTGCCSRGSVCCSGNCYPGPCECSGGQCVHSHYERPGVVINGNQGT